MPEIFDLNLFSYKIQEEREPREKKQMKRESADEKEARLVELRKVPLYKKRFKLNPF